ncbi:glutamate synthase-related protein [Limnohabitans sp. 2KL-3]|uniref:glutamate synthase-related protein n=1 Tax=Limnohabitans sp. 2KL-3 TaxID=1100700 RepID=UPI001E4CC250|nr:glutamate synthase-related protein [Limnohabitans sp. 2KL-3]
MRNGLHQLLSAQANLTLNTVGMFALGCIQSRSCHTDHCPTGVATQDPVRQLALVVTDKAERVYYFHANTLHALADLVGAAGLQKPGDITPQHLMVRNASGQARTLACSVDTLQNGQLLQPPNKRRHPAQPLCSILVGQPSQPLGHPKHLLNE